MPEVETEVGKVELKRELGFLGAVSIVVGSIIGSGIFISPIGVLRGAGSVGLCLIIWVAVGFITILMSLCYSELGTMITKSGGGYTYLRMGVGNPFAFSYVVQSMLFGTPGALVIMLGTCAKYLVTMFPLCGSPVFLEKTITVTLIIGLFLANMRSSRLAARVMIFTANAKVIALIIIIVGGIVSLAKGNTGELNSGFDGTNSKPTSLIMAYFSCDWAYGGGDNLISVVEEVKNPAKTIPRAFVVGISLVTLVYLLTNVSYLVVLTKAEMLDADATAVAWGEIVLGAAVLLIPLSVAISTLGSSSSSFFSSTRVFFTAARDGNIPDVVSYLHVKFQTPLVATTLIMAMSIALVMPGDVSDLINYLGFLSAFYKGCILVSFLRFRYTLQHVHRPIKVNLLIPIFLLLLQIFLFVTPMVLNPTLEFVWTALGVFGGSAILYFIFIKFQFSLPYLDYLITWIQLTLEVSPPPKFDDKAFTKDKKGDEKAKEKEINKTTL